MKRILLLLVCVCMTGMVLAQDVLFKKYGNTRGVETVFISKSMSSMTMNRPTSSTTAEGR